MVLMSLLTNFAANSKTSHARGMEHHRTNAEQQLLARRKAAKMLIAVVVMFGVCYLPVHLLNILRWVAS